MPDEGVVHHRGHRRLGDLPPDQGRRPEAGRRQGHRRPEETDPVGHQVHERERSEAHLPLQQTLSHHAHRAQHQDDGQQLQVRGVLGQSDDRAQQRGQRDEQSGEQEAQRRGEDEGAGDVGPLETAGLDDGGADAELAQHHGQTGDHRGRRGGAELLDRDQAGQDRDGHELEDGLTEGSEEGPAETPERLARQRALGGLRGGIQIGRSTHRRRGRARSTVSAALAEFLAPPRAWVADIRAALRTRRAT